IPMKVFLRHVARMAALVVAAAIACALLVRYSPGALLDDREMDQRLSEQSLAALRAERAAKQNVVANLVRYLGGLPKGDLGYSNSHNAPIATLIADGAPATLREIAVGLAGAWLLGLSLAIPVGRFREAWMYDASSATAAGLMLSLPAALLAYFCLLAGGDSTRLTSAGDPDHAGGAGHHGRDGYLRGRIFPDQGERAMKAARIAAVVFLSMVALAALLPELWAPASYETQFRDAPDAR